MKALLAMLMIVSLGVAVHAQPQAPITWGAIRYLPTPALEGDDYAKSIWSHGDTLVAVGCNWRTQPEQFFPKLAFSTDNGATFGPWHVLYSPDSAGECWSGCDIAFVSDAILCRAFDPLFPRSNRFGFWRTTDLGWTWEQPVFRDYQLRYYDQHGDTLFCRAGFDSVTWTCDGGHTFAPRRSVGFEQQDICDLAVSGQSMHVMTWHAPHDTARQRVHYARGPLLAGDFDSVVVVNPDIGWTDLAAISFAEDGTGVIVSSDEYQPPAPDWGAIIVNVTRDDGVTWSPADTLTPTESAAHYWLDIWHWNHWWLACWQDTVRDPGFIYPGLRCAFSPNHGLFWYPSQQFDGTYALVIQGACGEIRPSRVRISMAMWDYCSQPRTFYFVQWEGQIHADSLPPTVSAYRLQCDTVAVGDTLRFSATATDNDTVFEMRVEIRSHEDSSWTLIMNLLPAGTFQVLWTVPGAGLYRYRIAAEDRWENVGAYPDTGWATFVTQGWSGAADRYVLPPSSFSLSVFPNPFNARTEIRYVLPRSGRVSLRIHDVLGREVAVLMNEIHTAGRHRLMFDASGMPSGVYLCRLEAGEMAQTRKMVLVK